MHDDLQQINEAAQGLTYMSESDYPFEIVHIKDISLSIEKELLQLVQQPTDTSIEKISLDYLFRNMTKGNTEIAKRFVQLQNLLKEKLKNVEVYRIGAIEIDAFIIGKLEDGTYAGLRTKVIET
jgi:hypothetical protein